MLKRAMIAMSGGAFAALALAGSAFATTSTYDVSPVTSGITDQITATLPVVLPVAGALIALGLAIKLVRRFAKV